MKALEFIINFSMHTHHNHGDLVTGFVEEQKEVFNSSDQAMYVFLDDGNRACNEKFAKLLGYSSADDWKETETNGAFPMVFVDEKSQQTLVSTFQKVMTKMIATQVNIAWKKKNGDTVDTTVIIMPIVFEGHLFALHYVSKK